MGAYQFSNRVNKGKDSATAREAFISARDEAAYMHGHGGYTGTIAEKGEFVEVGAVESWGEAEARAESLMEADDPRIADKWGPAGCVVVRDPERPGWLFFGWASS